MKIAYQIGLAVVFAPLVALAQPGSPDGLTYKTGYSAIMKLGSDLQKALKPKYKDAIHSQPVSMETSVTPFIRLEEVKYPDDPKALRMVFISVGFIDLMNYVAHAKAIDRIQKGYFEKYVLSLSKESGAKELQELPNLSDKRFWTEDMLNEQLSFFNQMVGMVIAIELSHHYMGHFSKYSAKLTDDKGPASPINNLLTPSEWDEAMRVGARNALDCGLGADGLKALYEAINKMPQRPAWTAYFLPATVKVDKVRKDLEKIEKRFFAGEDF